MAIELIVGLDLIERRNEGEVDGEKRRERDKIKKRREERERDSGQSMMIVFEMLTVNCLMNCSHYSVLDDFHSDSTLLDCSIK